MLLQAMTQQRMSAKPVDLPSKESVVQGPQAMSLPLHVLQQPPAGAVHMLPQTAAAGPVHVFPQTSARGAASVLPQQATGLLAPPQTAAGGQSEGGILREFYFDLTGGGAPAPPSTESASPRPSTSAASTKTPSRPENEFKGGSFNAAPENLAKPIPLPPLPRSLLCPISNQVMKDPVTAADGMTYEQECIVSWFQGGHSTSPVTEAKLDSLKLRPNDVLRAIIEDYMALRDFVQNQQREWEGFAALREFRVSQKLTQKKQQVRDLKAALELSERRGILLRSTKESAMSTSTVMSAASTSISTALTPRSRGSGPSSEASPRNAALEQLTRSEEGAKQEVVADFKAGKAPRHPMTAVSQTGRRRRREACPVLLLGS